ncbi:MAG: 3-isopropylmalate dehydrogenase [Patescibacteria group bacterium]|nr:MAG: 3-isopropylmalate dehydrogenase [Patescibacteria group bacterium]
MKTYKIAVLPGDGIGPEVTRQSVKILKELAKKYKINFKFQQGLIGAAAIKKTGKPLPEETLKLCLSADAILFGAIGDPEFDKNPKLKVRPEQGLLALRKALNLYANIRPVKTYPSLYEKSPLKKEIVSGVDFVVVRELTGGIYFGQPRGRSEDGATAFDTCSYSREEIERVAKVAFELALERNKKVTVVDKANVLATSRLWREVILEFSADYKSVDLEFMYVDNAAMQIIRNPKQFDVILTENMFGDILTDEASVLTGSLGMLASASIGELGNKTRGLFEPIHGSYPQAAGKNIANPSGSILSAAEMLKFLGESQLAEKIEKALDKTLEQGTATQDINEENYSTCSEFAERVIRNLI